MKLLDIIIREYQVFHYDEQNFKGKALNRYRWEYMQGYVYLGCSILFTFVPSLCQRFFWILPAKDEYIINENSIRFSMLLIANIGYFYLNTARVNSEKLPNNTTSRFVTVALAYYFYQKKQLDLGILLSMLMADIGQAGATLALMFNNMI